MKELIRSLVEATGPSGYETQVRELVHKSIAGLADEVKVDALGNLIARKGKLKEGGKRVMLSAHMDEIGLIATFVDDNGFIRFTANGGVFPVYLLGSRVRFLNGVEGVIGAENNNLRDQSPAMDKCFIDVGAKDRQGCPVSVGDMAVFVRPFLDLGDRLVSKALDDRVGVAILVEALKQLQQSSGMGDLVNLRQAKKRKARAEARAEGDANAARFGRTNGERLAEKDAADRAARTLDRHRVERDD